jgi:hypothetical protein
MPRAVVIAPDGARAFSALGFDPQQKRSRIAVRITRAAKLSFSRKRDCGENCPITSVHRPSSKAMQYGWLTPNLLSGLDLTEIDSYCTD